MPVKRDEFLQSLSREHHHGLLLCWKIRNGLKNKIEPDRIKRYTDWFWETHLKSHFEIEEKYIFPILDDENELVLKALAEHRSLNRLFKSTTELLKNLSLIAEELESHIRFEERILFNEIQSNATTAQLELVKLYHSDVPFADDLTDPFWL
jgi:iron-sulfur cluster repair protein YtfE (RIC family)